MTEQAGPILILGGNGFIGSAVVECLSRTRELVVASRRPASAATDVIAGLKYLPLPMDLDDVRHVHELITELEPSVIVNCAAAVNFHPTAEVMPLWRLNAFFPSLLAEVSLEFGSHVIQLSGSIVHGSRPALAAPEIRTSPDSAYGRSKLLGDEMMIASGAEVTILRLPGVFGRHGPSHLGLNRAIADATSGAPIELVGDGTARRNYVSSQQVADIVNHCIDRGPLGVAYVGGEIVTLRTCLEEVAALYDVPLRVMDGPSGQDSLVECDSRLPMLEGFASSLRRDQETARDK